MRNLEIIGEAVKNISDECKGQFSLVPWQELAGLRDRLIHHYFGVDYDIVWVIVREELSAIKLKIEEVLNNKKEDNL